ncbi:ATP-binding protein [Sporomusa carbonis]|uniref:ATP-binding protein n=1 Tax=Sporomusa carbonis TaxID=3076075 RepID=UPI003C7E9C41
MKDFTLDTTGGNVSVYGDNETGKTSLADAWFWLLFEKDSQNKKDFSIKNSDETGKAISGLEHEVEGTLQLDQKRLLSVKFTPKNGPKNVAALRLSLLVTVQIISLMVYRLLV